MEFQFLDSRLNVDLTNLIASFVGPQSNKFVKKINKMYSETVEEIFEEILKSNTDEYEEYYNISYIEDLTLFESNTISEEEVISKFQRKYFDEYKERRDDRLREIEILKCINWNDDDSISFIDD